MSANKEETLRQFCDVTGADETRSKFFLESSNWQLDVALSSFYENGGNVDEVSSNPSPASAQPMSDSDMESPPVSPAQPKKKDKKKNPHFATLDSLHQDESSSDEEEGVGAVSIDYQYLRNRIEIIQEAFCYPPTCSKNKKNTNNDTETDLKLANEEIDKLKEAIIKLEKENLELREEIAKLKENVDNESGQAFYAGGSERSGQQILGPGKGRKDFVAEMFKSVKERGATVFDEEPTSTGSRHGVFTGVGYRLGQTADDHEQVTPGSTQSQNQPRQVHLRLYREGFTVDDGPLRHYTDPPENVIFLNCIRRGEIPHELAGRGEVRVRLEDRRNEECPVPTNKTAAFTGKGQMLGSPTPATVGATVPIAASGDDREANLRAAQAALRVDTAQPLTTVQFRLADGSRLTGQFNHTHTVRDLMEYVSRAEPAYQLQTFVLLTSYPSAELSDPSLTLAQANILNTTLLQRLK